MRHVKTEWLAVAPVVLLVLGPFCVALGINLHEFITVSLLDERSMRLEARLETIGNWLASAGFLLCYAGEGAMCLLAMRIGRLAREAWHAGELGSSASRWFASISLVGAALWFAFVTWLLLYRSLPVVVGGPLAVLAFFALIEWRLMRKRP